MLHFFILTRKYQKGKVKEKKGNTCKPMAVSFQCMTKSTTNKKKELDMTEAIWHTWMHGYYKKVGQIPHFL